MQKEIYIQKSTFPTTIVYIVTSCPLEICGGLRSTLKSSENEEILSRLVEKYKT